MGVFSHLPTAPRDGGFYPKSISYSCRFNDDDSPSLKIADATGTNKQDGTWSWWMKRCNIKTGVLFSSSESGSLFTAMGFNTAGGGSIDSINWFEYYGGAYQFRVSWTPLFRDPAAWYHCYIVYDASQSGSDKYKLWINGVQAPDAVVTTDNNNYSRLAGHQYTGYSVGTYYHTANHYDGYLAEVHHLYDYSAGAVTDFGEFKNGIWVPKEYTGGNYGTLGHHLDFSNSGNFGEDQSGQNNDFTSSGLASNDQFEDTPTNNWCTLSDVDKKSVTVLSDGALTVAAASSTFHPSVGTALLKSGKWYCEVDVGPGAIPNGRAGIGTYQYSPGSNPGADAYSWALRHSSTSSAYAHDGVDVTDFGDTWSANDILQIAFDVDSGKLWFGKNNSWYGSGDPAAGTNAVVTDSDISGGVSVVVSKWLAATTCIALFGANGFNYTPPSGFNPICSENMDEPAILEGHNGFEPILYTGTGAEKAITELEFSPDLVWVKNRDAADEHVLTDSNRGATKEINTDSTNVESTVAQGVKSFDTNGFTLGTDARYNTNAEEYAAWSWLEDPVYGFDIVPFTGTGLARTIAHNLGVIPEIIIVKSLDSLRSWSMYHHTAGNAIKYQIDLGGAEAATGNWNSTTPTASVFSIGTGAQVNASGEDYIAYLWAPTSDYSSFGTYIGNGSLDGPLVKTAFRPSFVWIKARTVVSSNHVIMDRARWPFNRIAGWLYPDVPAAEGGVTSYADLLSNGFKLRTTSTFRNGSGSVYWYMAFAENPFKYANAR